MRLFAQLLAGFISALLCASCASPHPKTMLGDENFAVIYATPVNCVARGACTSRVLVKAINGAATQNLTSQYNYQVEPGEVSVIVIAHTVLGDKMPYTQGVCELKWIAEAGHIYVLDREIMASGFAVTAVQNGETVASCFAEFA